MASPRSPQLGYNHNIPHRGRLYHVQTEDSGVDRAHIFTHVFFDGTIISSNKVEYRDQLEAEDLDGAIIGLMQESHKHMIRSLRNSVFDEKIVATIGDHPTDSNDAEAKPAAAAAPPPEAAPAAATLPEPVDVEPAGAPLQPGRPPAVGDPGLSHPAVAAAGRGAVERPSRGPRGVRRRAIGGIGGRGVREGDAAALAARRDIIVGKFASEHQAQLDEEILSLLSES